MPYYGIRVPKCWGLLAVISAVVIGLSYTWVVSGKNPLKTEIKAPLACVAVMPPWAQVIVEHWSFHVHPPEPDIDEPDPDKIY